jgi:hypothetical protein
LLCKALEVSMGEFVLEMEKETNWGVIITEIDRYEYQYDKTLRSHPWR